MTVIIACHSQYHCPLQDESSQQNGDTAVLLNTASGSQGDSSVTDL
jgi:hypothetical protein